MPRLYCVQHGQEDEARAIERQEYYRQEGESVLIVTGKLISGPWLCDRCNETLGRGSVAFASTSLPRWLTESDSQYDFAYEQRYFGRRLERIALYGAACSGIRNGMNAGNKPSRKSSPNRERPLCALDFPMPHRSRNG